MKTISANNDAQWDSKLLNDLGFIKKNLRYPYSAKTLAPVILVGIVTLLVFALEIATGIAAKAEGGAINYKPFIFCAVIFVPFIVSVVRYFSSLKFVSIPTQNFSSENRQLIEDFLKAQHLVVFRHPDAPEVFQIISKSIYQYKDRREVMIFIADDKRILVNSHFTNQGFVLIATAPHRKEMSQALKNWIKANSQNVNTDIEIIS